MYNKLIKSQMKLLLVLFIILFNITNICAQEIKQILLLNSYHPGFEWTDDLTKGVIDGIGDLSSNRVFVEYMDLKRFPNQDYINELKKLYIKKYTNIKLDGIICADNYAFEYFLNKGDSIWDKALPVSVCGVNNIDDFTYDKNRIKVVKEELDIKNTLNNAFLLNPNTDTLIVISDQTLSGDIFLSQFIKGLHEFDSKFPYIILDGSDYENIRNSLSKIHKENKIIILLSLYSNKYDVPIEMKYLGMDLLKDVDIPIYSFWEFLLGDFIVGGNLISSYYQGYDAAKLLAIRLENPKDLEPDFMPCTHNYIYDYNLIKKFDLNYKQLPKSTTYINKTVPFYIKHKKKLIFYGLILSILIILNLLLITNSIRRRRIEGRLTESEKRLELALESANEGFWDITLINNQVVINKKFSDLLGYSSPDEISIGINNWQNLIYKKDLKKIYKNWKRYQSGKIPLFKSEARIYLKNKHLKWFSIHGKITETDSKNNPIRLTGVLMDISEQKKIEIKLKKAKEKAEESDKLKSRFLANMSHEIRTPMNAILGFSDILLDQDLESFEQSGYLDQIKTSGENLLNIINDIVDISKIESDQLHIRNERFELNQVLKHISYSVDALIKSKNKNISFKIINSYSELWINSDPFRIEQVLLNLLSNAVKFTNKGEIKLELDIVKDNILIIKVIDTGEGITPEDINIIFERFRQAERTTKINAGTGLGLSITKSLIELMGGFITVKSKLNEGSVFTISLPVVDANNI